MAKTVVLRNRAAQPQKATCSYKTCKEQLRDDLQQMLATGLLDAFGTWSFPVPPGTLFPAPNPLAVLHTLSGGAGPDIRVLEWQGEDAQNGDTAAVTQARADFAHWHQADLDQGRCIVVRSPTSDMELVLVPAKAKTGGGKSTRPVYWGFAVTAHLLPLVARVIHTAKLVVVFDIDETLLMAHTVDSLQARLNRIQTDRIAKTAELANLRGSSDQTSVQEKEAELAAMDLEQELLQKDFDMLSFFRRDSACRVEVQGPHGVPPQVYEPSWETAMLATGDTVTRPVVRLELGGRPVYITRIQPHQRNTSMLIRPRPGWEQLRAYMAGLSDLDSIGIRKERWEVYLCTTAEREYAWEAWRLLDPQSSLFPLKQLEWRMLCVQHPQKKDLLNVLRKQEIDAAASHRNVVRCLSDPHYVTDKARAGRASVGAPVPLCVVVDDRIDVWEEDSRKSVLQVMPFHPHKEAANLDLGADIAPQQTYQQAVDSEKELMRVQLTIRDVRGHIYQTLDKFVKPEAARLTTQGVSEQMQSTADSITKNLLLPAKSVPELLAESPHKPPAALGSSDKDERASDLRLLARDGTMMSPANGTSSSGGSAQQQQQQQLANGIAGPPADPRKRRLAAMTAAEGGQAATQQPGAPTLQPQQHQAATDQHQEQQQPQLPPAKKQKKEKKKGAFGDIMNSLQRQASEQQGHRPDESVSAMEGVQSPADTVTPAAVPSAAPSAPSTAAAAAAAGRSSAVNVQPNGVGSAAAAGPSAAAAVSTAEAAQASKVRGSSSSAGAETAAAAPAAPSATAARGAALPAAAAAAAPGKGISGLAAAAAAVTTGGPTAALSSAQQQVQLLLGPLSQAFAAPSPPDNVLQLLTSIAGGAPLNSPEAATALLQLLPQALREMVPAQDMWTVLAAVKLLVDGTAAGATAEVAGLHKVLPPRISQLALQLAGWLSSQQNQHPHIQEAVQFLEPILCSQAAAVQVGQLPPPVTSQPQAQPQPQQLQGVAAADATPPPSSLNTGGGGVHVVDLRSMAGAAAQQAPLQHRQQQQQQLQQQHPQLPGVLPATGALNSGMEWQPMQQGAGGQGGQLSFGALGLNKPAGGQLAPGAVGAAPGTGQNLQPAVQGLTLQTVMQQQQQQQMVSQPGSFQLGPQPGGGLLQGLGGGPVYLVQTPGGVSLQQGLPPGPVVHGPPPPMHQPGQLGLSGPPSGGQQQQQQQLMLGPQQGLALQPLQQQQQQQHGLPPAGGRGPGPGFQQQQQQGGRGGRSGRGGKPWALRREHNQQQQGQSGGEGRGQGGGVGQQGRGGRGGQGHGRDHKGGGRGRHGGGQQQGRGQQGGRGRGQQQQ